MRFRLKSHMHLAVILAAILAVLSLGFNKDDNRVKVVRSFITAVQCNDRDAIKQSLTMESRSILERSQPEAGINTFSYLLGGTNAKEGLHYKLVLTKAEKDLAYVNLKPGKEPTKGFRDPTLPKDFVRNGVPIVVIKDAGKWKVDLLATIELFIEHSAKDVSENIPKWWPVPFVPEPALLRSESSNQLMKDYNRALELYEAGRLDAGLELVRQLAKRELRFGSERDIITSGHYPPSLTSDIVKLRNIWRRNSDYANELSLAGKQMLALQVLLVNLDIANQIVHIQPPETTSIISGAGLWKCTWRSIAKELEALGETNNARTATSCAEAITPFFKRHVEPLLEEEERRIKRLEELKDESAIAKMNKDSLQNSLRESRRLLELWDKEILNAECKQLIKVLETKK